MDEIEYYESPEEPIDDSEDTEDDGFPRQCLFCKEDCDHAGIEGYSHADDECNLHIYYEAEVKSND